MRRLADGRLMLHIGPHKTGSTTLQLAMHRNRPQLAAQGVHYAGPMSQPMTAAMVAATGMLLPTRTSDAASAWDELVQEVTETTAARVVISSEFFCEADAEHAASILDRLGRHRSEVVITLRPLSRILASQWQQYVQNRVDISYSSWLETELVHPDRSTTPSFWARHRHDVLVQRWARCAGAEHVTVLVVDETDPTALLRTTEELLSLTPGTLDPGDMSANRSLTYPEVELLRGFNTQWRRHRWSEADYTRLVRFGAVRHLQARQPAEGEPRILTPAWAVDRATELSARMVEGIAGAGVEVIGDLDRLVAAPPPDVVGDNEPPVEVPVEIAARFAGALAVRFGQLAFRPLDPTRQIGPLETTARRRAAERG